MNAITLLKADHKTVNDLFRRFERSGANAYKTRRDIVDRIVEELSIHAAIEELAFYPIVRAEVRGAEDMTLEALEEHHIVKWTLSELDSMDPHDERFEAKVTVLIESVRHHVEEEESDLFPKVRDALSAKRLNEIGDALAAAKKTAPTRPHPRLPDTPPLNALSSAAAVADRVTEKVLETAKSAIDFANPLTTNGDAPAVPARAKKTAASARKTAKGTRTKAATAAKKTTKKARTATTRAKKTASKQGAKVSAGAR